MEISELKKKIRELRGNIATAIQAKQHAQVKKLRRQKRRLKAQSRRLAKAKRVAAEATPATPPPAA